MRQHSILTVTAICLLLFAVTVFASASHDPYVSDRIVVKLTPAAYHSIMKGDQDHIAFPTGMAELDRVAKAYGVSEVEPLFMHDRFSMSNAAFLELGMERYYMFQFSMRLKDAEYEQRLAELSATAGIEFSEPSYLHQAHFTPNDWGLSSRSMWGFDSVRARQAWDTQQGDSTILAVTIDTGVEYNHEDLYPNIKVNTLEDINHDGRFTAADNNSIDDDGNGYIDDVIGWDFCSASTPTSPDAPAVGEEYGPRDNTPYDVHGHGTHVCGSIAARTNNGVGVPSVSHNVRTICLRAGYAWLQNGTTLQGSGSSTDFIPAIQYAVARGARIISISFGGGSFSQSYQDAITLARNNNCLVFGSAGNSNVTTVSYPAGYTGAMSVAALNTGDVKASFSNYGAWVDISAPGVNIWSTMVVNTYNPNPYVAWQGTSMACPTAAAAAALALSHAPTMSDDTLEARVRSTAININGYNPSYVNQLGAGCINAYALVQGAAGIDSVIIYTPNGGEGWDIGLSRDVTYYAHPSITDVRIDLNRNYPAGTWETLTSSWTNDGTFTWFVTGPATTTARIRVLNAANPAQGDTSAANFSLLSAAAPPVTQPFNAGTFPPTGWMINNPDANMTWTSHPSGYAEIDFFDYAAQYERDALWSPTITTVGLTSGSLSYNWSYVLYSSTYNDSLIVAYTTNNGDNWTALRYRSANGTGTSALVAGTGGTSSTPATSNWGSETLTLPAGALNQPAIRFGFIGVNQYGSNLYVDNFSLTGTTGTPPPTAPTNLAVGGATINSLQLSWTDNSNNETGFVVTYSTDGTNFNALTTTAANATSYTHTGRAVNTQYWYRVAATNANGTSSTASANGYTLAAAPAVPVVGTVTATSIALTPQNNSSTPNPATTQYALYETTTSRYVQANGTLSAAEVWQTLTTWGTKTVTGLTASTTYTFYAKARNGANVVTANSTSVSATTSTPITMQNPVFTPAWGVAGGSYSVSVNYTASAAPDSIVVTVGTTTARLSGASGSHPGTRTYTGTITLTGTGLTSYSISAYAGGTQTARVPATGTSYGSYRVTALSGGPINSNYYFRATGATGTPAMQWVDISSTGTTISFSNTDDGVTNIAMTGFSFPFFGTNYSSVYVSTNGNLQFSGTGNTAYSNVALPATVLNGPAISLLWDDMIVSNVKHRNMGDGRYVFSYTAVLWRAQTDTIRMQAVLHSNGKIQLQYLSVADPYQFNATVGIQRATTGADIFQLGGTDMIPAANSVIEYFPAVSGNPVLTVVPNGQVAQLAWTSTGVVDEYRVYKSSTDGYPTPITGTLLRSVTTTTTNDTLAEGASAYYIVTGYINIGGASDAFDPLNTMPGIDARLPESEEVSPKPKQ